MRSPNQSRRIASTSLHMFVPGEPPENETEHSIARWLTTLPEHTGNVVGTLMLHFSARRFWILLAERFENWCDWFTQSGKMPMPSLLRSSLSVCAPGFEPAIRCGTANVNFHRRLPPGGSLVLNLALSARAISHPDRC